MPEVQANGIAIHYEVQGDVADPAILLIMGIGGQMTLWPDELITKLVKRGYRVIRFDNRDVGLSQKFDGATAPPVPEMIARMQAGQQPEVPYTLADMADDAAGLLDALSIETAHIVGVSMGAMIAQHFASKFPDIALSLTSFSSTTGALGLKPANNDAVRALAEQPASLEEEALVEHGVKVARAIGSPGFPAREDSLLERTLADIRRSFYPAGPQRQRAAIIADGDRTAMLARLDLPTLVIHGDKDPIFPLEHGQATADSIPGAVFRRFAGLGHDLPLELVDPIATAIADHAEAAGSR